MSVGVRRCPSVPIEMGVDTHQSPITEERVAQAPTNERVTASYQGPGQPKRLSFIHSFILARARSRPSNALFSAVQPGSVGRVTIASK